MEKKNIIDLMLSKLNREIDISWAEISKETGLDFSDSHIRKMAYGVKFYDEYLKNNLVSNCTVSNEIEKMNEKILELKRKRQQLSDERTLTNKKIRSLARLEDFINLFKDELELLSYEKPLVINSTPEVNFNSTTGVLLLSDIHYGIEINDICGNTYNPEVAKMRMKYLCEKTIEYCREQNVHTLYVNSLGDLISGHIHNTIRLENRIDVVQQIIGISEIISYFLHRLCTVVPKVYYYSVEGNHDRVLPKKEDNLNKDSFNTLIHELITQRTANIKNLFVEKSNNENYNIMNIDGLVCVSVHGDKDKISNAVKGLETITDEKIAYVFMGHYHNANEFTDNQSEIIVNGSFSGVDEYAYNLRKNSKTIQKLLIFDKNERKCTYNINVS